jgi:hypothetical protein
VYDRQQDRQCTYNVTLRRVHQTIVTVEKQKLLLIRLCVHAHACVHVGTRAPVIYTGHSKLFESIGRGVKKGLRTALRLVFLHGNMY